MPRTFFFVTLALSIIAARSEAQPSGDYQHQAQMAAIQQGNQAYYQQQAAAMQRVTSPMERLGRANTQRQIEQLRQGVRAQQQSNQARESAAKALKDNGWTSSGIMKGMGLGFGAMIALIFIINKVKNS